MSSGDKQSESKQVFEPLEIMGVFWFFFGIVVLLGTFFIKSTDNVPLVRGIVTNIIASSLLLAAGIFSILKGRSNKRRRNR
jgi:hypothetical protein